MRLLGRILLFGLIGAVLLCGAGAGVAGWFWSRAALSTAGEIDFVNRLAIPPLAESRVDDEGRRVFELTADEGQHDFGGTTVPTWGFNGDYLGPTLRAKRGEQVQIKVHNKLGEATTVHWHGMHLPPEMDGGPHQMIAPNATWSPTWRIDQPATTLWYHPHLHGKTADHVYRGLAGMFILDDPDTSADLPDEYGVDDIPVIVQDKKFSGGQLDATDGFAGVGIIGDTIAVNGTVAPYQEVTTERVRLRLLNGSNARIYDFGFADNREFALVGTDGGLLETPYYTDRVMLSPGERAEIVVAMKPGERAVLRSFPPDTGMDMFSERFTGSDDTLDILELRAADRLADNAEVPERLVDIPKLDPADAVAHREFKLSGYSINGHQMSMGRIDLSVQRDTTEVWELTNWDGQLHSFHVHDVQFQVVSVGGAPPPPELAGWKDTIFLRPYTRMRIVMRFADYADPNVPYMYHCHVLYHEDLGMMGQFVVLEPGQRPGTPPTSGQDHHHAGHHGG